MSVDEWDYRALCPDGGCTGVIGPNGQCKVCGRAAQNWGDERKRGMRNPTDPLPVVAISEEPSEISPTAPAVMGVVLSAWNSRQLCVDGGCIGIVGADGKCGVCGKAGAVVAKGTAENDEYEDDSDEYEDDDEDDVEETGANADEAQAEDGEEDDEGDDDDEDSDDDDDESDDDDDDEEPDDEDSPDSIHASAAPSAPLEAGSLEPPPERVLCPDGACVGVIGADGLCKVCGKANGTETSA